MMSLYVDASYKQLAENISLFKLLLSIMLNFIMLQKRFYNALKTVLLHGERQNE